MLRHRSATFSESSIAVLILFGLGACSGPTSSRTRHDAADISEGGSGGDNGGAAGDNGGVGGFGGFGGGFGGSGGSSGGGSGGSSGGGSGGSAGGVDAGTDGGSKKKDGGGDGAVDAPSDAGMNDDAVAPTDSAADQATDQAPPATDAGVDVAVDAASDAAPDVAVDMASDSAPDVGPDLAPVDSTGLVGYWKFDETSGTTAMDSSTSMNNGTLTTGATFGGAAFPNATFVNTGSLTLAATGTGHVELGTTRIPNNSAVQTVSMWVNYGAQPATGNQDFVSFVSPTTMCGIQIGLRGANLSVWKWGGAVLASKTAPAPGWHNVVYTFDGTTHSLIVDGGTAVTSTMAAVSCAPTNVEVGAYVNLQGNQAEFFRGNVDDLRIYNRVLSATEVATINAGGDPSVDLTTNLVGYWKLDEGAGTSAADSSPSGNTGTLVGTPTWVAGAKAFSPFAISLNGTTDAVSLGFNQLPAANQNKSVSLWFNYAAAPTTGNHDFFSFTDGAACGLQIGTRTTGLAVWPWGAIPVFLTATAPAVGWHHLVYTYDGTNHVLYIDTVQVATSTTANTQTCTPTNATIGAYRNATTGLHEFFHGEIDDVRVWKDRVLTTADVSALFNGQ